MKYKQRFMRWLKVSFWGLILASGIIVGCGTGSTQNYEAYLFTYFTGNNPGEEAIRFAVSTDGYNFRALNNNLPVIDSKEISSSGGVRDPHILRCADNKSFYMVVTDLYVPEMSWNNYAMVLMKSDDLLTWESSIVNIPETFPEKFGDVNRVWAPQTFYDEQTGKYMIYFSMKQGENPDIIYYANPNKDFTAQESEPKQLFYNPTNNSCIDGDLIFNNGKYHLFMKSETGDPGIKLATSDKLTEGYVMESTDRVDKQDQPVEGSGIFKLNNSDEWILMYDVYTQGKYQFTKSSDLKNFTVIDQEISMNFNPRHGTVMPITNTELKRLIAKWGTLDDLLVDVRSTNVKKQNIVVNAAGKNIHLPVKANVNLAAFNPEFTAFPGINMKPSGEQDFSKGPVTYSFTLEGKGEVEYQVFAEENHNPVLEGFYADPDILYSNKTGKFYLYPTSDGFTNWSGTYFKTFSSDNLVDWKDEGVILDLKKDVSWANRNAWAPCIIEKKIGEDYRYYYYFTAAQKIGVAVSDNPAGPFTDSGKPLIDFKPKGITGGQEIDPDVFQDPKTGKYYLYWGNNYLAGAELNDDMVSLKLETLKVITPDNTFREGTYVIYRDGFYYFMWSEDDTRSPNYKVRYAKATSPLEKLSIPENNIVIRQDEQAGIFATGHNSAIQIPGKDEWYLVYHRFTYPKGIEMGRSAGYNREVCIDKLTFGNDGNIMEVTPTHAGIGKISTR